MVIGSATAVKCVLDTCFLRVAQLAASVGGSSVDASRRILYAPQFCQAQQMGCGDVVAVLVVADVCHVFDGRVYDAQLKGGKGVLWRENPARYGRAG